MKYLHTFETKYLMDTSIANIKHKDGAFVFGVGKGKDIENITICDERHEGINCYKITKVNMEPNKLDESSSKKIPEVGDILYSTIDNRLTLDSITDEHENIAIAICIIPEVLENFENGNQTDNTIKTARFVSLNYMSLKTPFEGSLTYTGMSFGNYIVNVYNRKGSNTQDSYIGGKYNTQKCIEKSYNYDSTLCEGIVNKTGEGYAPAACCCNVYKTLGTKSGDWYLPSCGELYSIYINKNIINSVRSQLLGNGYKDGEYWSSRECTAYTEYKVNLSDGTITYKSKGYALYILAFIAVSI